ncbi:MAG: bifunctional phosphopantothenoylcysteine decarboxylase/phosphopantothenate--cysteine ligase CoaBC [Myxococcales bacterium]|nr:MAG: bifunctional phosphopantothenoylcysteine decarboxylase/phosphopantothenate--cysteine ligase CoaBC [Myxococcales bacterium]
MAAETRKREARRPTVALCVCGSIAAYKAAEVARGLREAGFRVLPVMTQAAEEFLGASTLAGLTGETVYRTMWDPDFAGEMHVALAQEADAIVIAPATADLIARLAQGRADDLVAALALVSTKPILVAPAMHPAMWSHPATRRNVALLDGDGRLEWVGPVDGPVASGETGVGRMASPAQIVEAVQMRLTPRDLAGLKIVITAGPTAEDLDPVRFLTNRSTGKMGFALARRAAARGAQVTLVAGPGELPTPHRVKRIDVRSAIAMRGAVWQALGPDLSAADALIMSAAVSDFRPAETHASKQKKRKGETSIELELTLNPDILAEIGQSRSGHRPMLVGFAVETDSDEKILGYAQGKLLEKKLDLVVANRASDSFGRADNKAMLVTAGSVEHLGVLAKEVLADRILDRVRLASSAAKPAP